MVFQKIRLSDVEPTLGIGRILGDSSAIELLDSMQSVGQLAPIKVRPHPTKVGKYQLVYGHRRYATGKTTLFDTIISWLQDMHMGEEHVKNCSKRRSYIHSLLAYYIP
ncbi:MAG: ParB N-terminal domain-containing protein [Nitrososphaerales archaeon]